MRPCVDGVADRDVAVSVAVRAHISRGGEARPQIGLHVLDGDQHGRFGCSVRLARVEHVRVRVDQAGQHGRLAQVDHLRARRNLDLGLRSDFGDPLTRKEHHLLRQHLAGLAVEHAAGADRDHARRWGTTLKDAAVGADARGRPRTSPRCRGRLNLSPSRDDAQRYRQRHGENRIPCHDVMTSRLEPNGTTTIESYLRVRSLWLRRWFELPKAEQPEDSKGWTRS